MKLNRPLPSVCLSGKFQRFLDCTEIVSHVYLCSLGATTPAFFHAGDRGVVSEPLAIAELPENCVDELVQFSVEAKQVTLARRHPVFGPPLTIIPPSTRLSVYLPPPLYQRHCLRWLGFVLQTHEEEFKQN